MGELAGVFEGLGEPVFDLLDDAIYPAIELDAGPAEACWIQAALSQEILEVVVVGLLAAVLQ